MTDKILQHASVANGPYRKNLLINGGFDIWQRGGGPFTGGYAADRWSVEGVTSVDKNTTGTPAGFTFNALINRNVAGTADIIQRIEGSNSTRLVGKSVTASFLYVANTGTVDSIDVVLTRPASTKDDFSSTTEIQRITLSSIEDVNTVSFSPLPTEVSLGLELRIEYTISAAATWRLTGVQLEPGAVATDFEQRTYAEELALCQRYYETGLYRIRGYTTAGNAIGGSMVFAASKRAAPSIAYSNTFFSNASNMQSETVGTYGFATNITIAATGSSTGVGDWSADAEL